MATDTRGVTPVNDDFYRALEEKFRGSRELIKSRLRVYLPFIEPLRSFYENDANAVDLGCGRGEWLELLGESGFNAKGVDLDDGMLAICNELGLNGQKRDAIDFLKELSNDSQAVISGFHIVEHIPFPSLQILIQEAFRVLKPGGILILETPNPENIIIATSNFYLDPTHQRPIPSPLLSFIVEYYGFERTKVIRLQESKTFTSQSTITLKEVFEGASPDYAVIAQKKTQEALPEKIHQAFELEYGLSLENLLVFWDNSNESRLQHVEAKAQHAEAKAQHAENMTNQHVAQLHAVYNSTSWRVTTPLRWLSSYIQRGKHFIKLGILLTLRYGILHIKSRPLLKRGALGFLDKVGLAHSIPDLELRIPSLIGEAHAKLAPITDRQRYLYVDVTGMVREDLKTGIQRVVRGLLVAMLDNPPVGFEIKPVYALEQQAGYRHASRFTQQTLGQNNEFSDESLICPELGDIFLGLDFQVHAVVSQNSYLTRLHAQGLKVCFIVYDLLPVKYPEWFPDVASVGHARWLDIILKFDKAICISNTVANDIKKWAVDHIPNRTTTCSINVFPMGSDIGNTLPSSGLPKEANEILNQLTAKPCFLIVGTLEPRKGHEQVFLAFEQLWAEKQDLCLVFIGKRGWKIEQLFDRISTHPERDKRFYWLQGVSDEYLEKIYAASTCLIAASYGEGFGLPLIEAAQHGLPILARDIPEFREVAGTSAHYFHAETPEDLAIAVLAWLKLFEQRQHPSSQEISHVTWGNSAKELCRIALSEKPV